MPTVTGVWTDVYQERQAPLGSARPAPATGRAPTDEMGLDLRSEAGPTPSVLMVEAAV